MPSITPFGMIGSHLNLRSAPPHFFLYMEKRPSFLPTYLSHPSNCPKRPMAPHAPPCKPESIHYWNWRRKGKKTREKFAIHQSRIKIWFDKISVENKIFKVRDPVLKWDKPHEEKGKHSKFQALWIGPFQIKEKLGSHTFRLQTLEGRIEVLSVNGHDLKHYFT